MQTSDEDHPNRRASKMVDWVRRRARDLGLEFDLDREWILDAISTGKCAVTGLEFDLSRGNGAGNRNRLAPSIDRIDPNHGYTRENCQMVIYQYNVAKGMWSHKDVLQFANSIVDIQKRNSAPGDRNYAAVHNAG